MDVVTGYLLSLSMPSRWLHGPTEESMSGFLSTVFALTDTFLSLQSSDLANDALSNFKPH